jgi:tRNA A37 threonylcarbamoyladenosine dehydratase
MLDEFSRTRLLLGEEGLERLRQARVAIFGIGGVGSYTAEALARSAVGALDLIDDDRVCLTNINRQLPALRSTVGEKKTQVMARRIADINPACRVRTVDCFYTAENADQVDLSVYDYVVDAIDTVSSKLTLIERAKAAGVPIISCMGAGNKLDPTQLTVADIYETSLCPLARVMRRELKKRGIESLTVVYSREKAKKPLEDEKNSCKHQCVCPPGTKRTCAIRRQIPGSVSFVPSAAGLILASVVVRQLSGSWQ